MENRLKIILILSFCVVFYRCSDDCELIRTIPIDADNKTEIFKCSEHGKSVIKEYGYLKDTLVNITSWNEGDSVKNVESYYGNGQMEAKWNIVNGQEQGELLCWFANGKLKRETSLQEGEFHGEFIEFFENGDTLFIGRFIAGKKDGLCETFSSDGGFTKFNYSRDTLHGDFVDRFWDVEGNKIVEITGAYERGKRSGNWIWKDLTGTIIRDATYLDDSLNGEVKIFHGNGMREIIATYVQGELSGDYKNWNDQGELLGHKIYKNNEVYRIIK